MVSEEYDPMAKRQYAFAAEKLLRTINFDLEDIKEWAILDLGATSQFFGRGCTCRGSQKNKLTHKRQATRWRNSDVDAHVFPENPGTTARSQVGPYCTRTGVSFAFVRGKIM